MRKLPRSSIWRQSHRQSAWPDQMLDSDFAAGMCVDIDA
ncbi:MAG: hypothetical protein ACI83P_001685, partial [Janthinobacterium sp.]